MPRRSSYQVPPDPEPKMFRSVDEIEASIRKLQRRLNQVCALDPSRDRWDDPDVSSAQRDIQTTILEVFGDRSPEYREHQYHRIWQGAEYVDMDDDYCQSCFAAGMKQTEGLLRGLIRRLEEARQDFLAASAASPQDRSHGQRVFIGHGHSEVWRELKDFLVDRLGLQFEDFNRQPVPGIGTKERLESMLDSTCFAFLLMTAEDVQPDGAKHARENVIHEVGPFQGRQGFRKAIVLLEEGCQEFSNIHGVGHIRFRRGHLMACFEEIRRVLEREGVLKKEPV